MKATFFQTEGYEPEGRNPRNNSIRALVVSPSEAKFVCTTVPGDYDLARAFQQAGLHPQGGWVEDKDTITIPVTELPKALDALLELDDHSPPQREFLTRLQQIAPHL
jgi:hypothetical protein